MDISMAVEPKSEYSSYEENDPKYGSILGSMLEGVQVINREWRYVYINDSLEKQSTYSKAELLGFTMMEKYPGIENTELFKHLENCMYNSVACVFENEFQFPDGTKGWFELSIQPTEDGIFILSVDITQRKLAELELATQNQLLQSMNKELEQFAYIASHDLQEPLRTTTSFVNLLEKEFQGHLCENSRLYLSQINKSVERMRMLITGLLEYSSIGRNKSRELVNCNELLQEVISDLGILIQESKAEVSVGQLPSFMVYRTELRQLFQNLITNALKFRHKDVAPKIEILATEEADCWRFSVRDNGIGISPEYNEKIFVIYQRLHSRREFEGSGIGLAHCKKIAELHSGKIWVDSVLGKGSTFFITISKK